MAGLSITGFTRQRIEDIKAEIEESLRGVFGEQINLDPRSRFGQIVGIFSERESLIWELAEIVYNSQYPDTATGAALDNVARITGIMRLEATFSFVTLNLYGTAATVVPTGTIASVSGNSAARFVTRNDVILVAGTDEIQTITFDVVPDSGAFSIDFEGDTTASILFSDGAAAVEAALEGITAIDDVTVTGSFAAGFVVTFVGDRVKKRNTPILSVSTNTLLLVATPVVITITETTPGVEQGTVVFDAETAGATAAPAFTLTVIETPVFGLATILNPLDATVGRDLETDPELRLRRESSLQVAGAATVEAIISQLRTVDSVTSVILFENDTFVTNLQGVPPKSFEAIVEGGTDIDVATKIFLVKAAGIGTFGSTSIPVVDSQGFTHTIDFSRPTDVDIFLEVDLTVNGLIFTATIPEIEAAFVAFGNALGIGVDVITHPQVECVLLQFAGITDVELRIGTAVSPTLDDNIIIEPDEISSWDTSRITITII